MGLRLRKHSSSFLSQVPEPPPRRASEPKTEIYPTSELFSYQDHLSRPPPRTARPPDRTGQQDETGRQRKRRRLLPRSQQEGTPCETRRVRSCRLWNRDAAEGYALARSSLQLPSDNNTNIIFTEPQWSRSSSSSRRRRSTSLSPRRGRPPSLERQDAFRDERTAKSRPSSHHHAELMSCSSSPLSQSETAAEHQCGGGDEEEEAGEIAELYRMGLLYYDDDQYERGARFSLDRIVRRSCAEGPVYSVRVRVRPSKRARREESSGFVSLSSVDLAFAEDEDEALAGWLMSGCRREEADARRAAAASVVHQPPSLTAVYGLADDAASAASAEDFLDSAYGSELSYCVGKDEASAWAIIDECNGTDETASAAEAEGGVGPWVVLGYDGS